MKIVDLKHPECEYPLTECGLCLGNFDGVHRGHRALIDELKAQNAKRARRLPLGALLFTVPPSVVLGYPVPQLTPLQDKLELLADAGLRFAILYDFNEIKGLSPDDFAYRILTEACRCRLAVCGFNYSYGAGGAGTPERLMQTFGAQPDHTLSVVPPVTEGTLPVSSSLIRTMLEQARPEEATRLMGHPFFITGTVRSGRRVGTKMGFPTANLDFPTGGLIPARGVYASTVRIGRRTYTAISNVGSHPTFEDCDRVNCETFIFDYHREIYGQTIRVSLLHFLRPEQKFASQEELEHQIHLDIARAKEYLW